ncbi:MAG TPA: HU family DNA-binding protein [Phycisphaeraceae bacterium]
MAKSATANSAKKALTKSQVYSALAEKTDLPKRDVAAVFDALQELIAKNIGSRGPGQFTVPGLMKIVVKKRPATKAREGINPATGEKIMIAAKPARKVVKIRPLKNLKAMI